jgi:tetratricopeptide (TPR) repeat protein
MRWTAALVLLSLLSTPARADWQVKRDPFDPRLVARYKELLHRNPSDVDALKRLTALYRAHRGLEALERECDATAARTHDVADQLLAGHVHRARGDPAGAERAYSAAHEEHPEDWRAAIALGEAELAAKRSAPARALFEAALAGANDPKVRKAVLEKLIALSLAPDRGLPRKEAMAEARRAFDELLRVDPKNDAIRRELAEALAAHDDPAAAAVEWAAIASHLDGDPLRRAEALSRAGELHLAAGDEVEALAAFRRCLPLLPRRHALWREAIEHIAGVYRKRDRLREVIAEWERAWPEAGRDFVEWDVLGRLAEEVGDAARARAAYERALAKDPHALETRRRLIVLHQRAGDEAQVIAEYRRLIAVAPGEPRFRVELAERLHKTPEGEREAVALCERTGQKTRDPAVHGALGELYTRWGMKDAALREEELLVRLEPDDDSHLVALGELYYQAGNKERALETWRRLLRGVGKREQRMARLAEVYGEHELPGESLDLYQKAVTLSPDDPGLNKGLAQALERMHRDGEAGTRWTTILERAIATRDRALALEARQRILQVYAKTGQLGRKVEEFAGRMKGGGEEALQYGLLAADGNLKLGRVEVAERLLITLSERDGDPELKADAEVGLAQVERQRHRVREVVAHLRRATELSPRRARELYPQIAELSLELYRDRDALTFAKKAVELFPTDTQAHVRLGEILEKKDDLDGAAAALKRARELDDRLWRVYFQLARIEIRAGRYSKAARWYREVLHRAPNEELVLDAARRAIDLEEFLGTLGDLERELAQLAYAHADKRVYRNLLVELDRRYAAPLVVAAHGGDQAARHELERLGEHGLDPLLDVLVDGDTKEVLGAAALLGELSNPSAAGLLLRLATARPPRVGPRTTTQTAKNELPRIEVRSAAALAGARLAAAKDVPMLLELLGSPERALRSAALAGLERFGDDARAIAGIGRALADGAAEVQAMACLATARLYAGRGRHPPIGGPALAFSDQTRDERARAACAVALGVAVAVGVGTAAQRAALVPQLVAGLDEGAPLLGHATAWALAVSGEVAARRALARAVFEGPEVVRDAAVGALYGSRLPTNEDWARWPTRTVQAITSSGDAIDLEARLGELTRFSAPERNLSELWEALTAAIETTLGRHRDLVLRTLADLDTGTEGLGLGPLTPAAPDPASHAELARLGRRVLPILEELATKGDAAVRERALRVLCRLDGGSTAIVRALGSDRPAFRLAALAALARPSSVAAESAAAATTEKLRAALTSRSWEERRAAALVLKRFPTLAAALRPFLATAARDENGLVATSAAAALGALSAAPMTAGAH